MSTEAVQTEPVVLPIGNRLLCKRLEKENVSRGGIILPEKAQRQSSEALVLARGPGKWIETPEGPYRQEFQVNVGDRVMIGVYGGMEAEVSGEKYVIVSEDDVLGIVRSS